MNSYSLFILISKMSDFNSKVILFPFEKQFQVFGILHGSLVGHDILVRPFLRRFSYVFRTALILCATRWAVATFYTDDLLVSFYLFNMSYSLDRPLPIYNLWMCALYTYWSVASIHLYSRMNKTFHHRFWLYLMPWNDSTLCECETNARTADQQLRRLLIDPVQYNILIQRFFRFTGFVKNYSFYLCLAVGSLLPVNHFLTFRSVSHLLPYYGPVFVLNSLSMVLPTLIGFMIYSLPFIFIYLCVMFQVKFEALHSRMRRSIRRYAVHHHLLYRHLRLFNSLVRQLTDVNLFWNQILGCNYLFSTALTAIGLIMLFESANWIMIFIYIFSLLLIIVAIFMLPLIVCGSFNAKVI